MPALACRVETGGRRILFGGNLRADTPGLADFMRGSDLLIMNQAIPGSAGRIARNLHATPERVGGLAQEAEVTTLVLSHVL